MLTSSALFIKINSGLHGMGIEMMYLCLIYFILFFFIFFQPPTITPKKRNIMLSMDGACGVRKRVFEKRDKLTLNSQPIPHLYRT